jgi:hypothetical protein
LSPQHNGVVGGIHVPVKLHHYALEHVVSGVSLFPLYPTPVVVTSIGLTLKKNNPTSTSIFIVLYESLLDFFVDLTLKKNIRIGSLFFCEMGVFDLLF